MNEARLSNTQREIIAALDALGEASSYRLCKVVESPIARWDKLCSAFAALKRTGIIEGSHTSYRLCDDWKKQELRGGGILRRIRESQAMGILATYAKCEGATA